MKSWRFSLAIAFALSLSLVFAFVLSSLMKTSTGALAQTDTVAPAPTQNAPFNGKIVVVSFVCGSNSSTIVLEQAQIRKLGDRYFLIGKGVDEGYPGNWMKAHMAWLPLNSVTSIAEMDSVEEMRSAYKAS